MLQRTPLLAIILISIMLFGCAAMKADPSTGAGFVPMEQMAKQGDLPFNKAWVKKDLNWKDYQTIYIKPVNTGYLLESNAWKEHFRHGRMQEDAQELARYMEDRFRAAFATTPDNRFRVVGSPEPGSLTLEMALTELVPGNVVLEALKYAPYGAFVAATVLSRTTGAVCTVAFEAKMKDTNPGAVVAMFADRETQKFKIIDVKAFTWYGNAKNTIDEWADQFVLVVNKPPGQIVEEASTFSLKPW